jgi:hypothetical protein
MTKEKFILSLYKDYKLSSEEIGEFLLALEKFGITFPLDNYSGMSAYGLLENWLEL